MLFKAAGYSDKGAVKASNQDSFLIKVANTSLGDVALVVVADGMGGLSKGELASAQAVRALNDWFENKLPGYLEAMGSSATGLERLVEVQMANLVQELNISILQYGKANRMNLGTTLTAFLCVGSRYSIVHVGDSRAYEITRDGAVQLTEDQTLVQRELAAGRITADQAKNHPQGNVLLQCVGASREVAPQISSGLLKKDATYLLCSDGFRHEITQDELLRDFSPEALESCWHSSADDARGAAGAAAGPGGAVLSEYEDVEGRIKACVARLIERGEKDNITAVVLSAGVGGDC